VPEASAMADLCVWLGEEAGDAGRDDGTRRETTELRRGSWWCARRGRGGGLGGALRAARGAVRASGVGSEKIARRPAGEGKEQVVALLDLGSWEESRVCHRGSGKNLRMNCLWRQGA